MKRKTIAFAAAAAVPLVAGGSTPTIAASAYDVGYRTTSSLQVEGAGCSTTDVTSSWERYIVDEKTWQLQYDERVRAMMLEARRMYYIAKNQGQIGVSTYNGSVLVYFTLDKSLSLRWERDERTDRTTVYTSDNAYLIWIRCAKAILGGNDQPVAMPDMENNSTKMRRVFVFVSNYHKSNLDDIKNLFVQTDYPNYPPGYAGKRIVYKPPAATYVAMGDSFSSGEGNPEFEDGTNTFINRCHRSWDAYSHLLSQDISLKLGPVNSVACSGATTSDVLIGRYKEQPKQIDALSKDTKVVTITIGGNDIGFAKFAETCITGDCSMDSKAYKDAVFMINHNIPNKLTAVLRAIAQKAPNAKVYVIGYPYVTPQKSSARWPQECMYLDNTKDSEAATEVVYRLNLSIKNTVTSYVNLLSSTKFQFVSANASPHGSFNGHDICQGSNSYFHNVTPSDITSDKNRPYIFHPNKAGQNEYYKIVKGAMLAK